MFIDNNSPPLYFIREMCVFSVSRCVATILRNLKRNSCAFNTRMFSDFHAISRKYKISKNNKDTLLVCSLPNIF
jgi:hypothetical protein